MFLDFLRSFCSLAAKEGNKKEKKSFSMDKSSDKFLDYAQRDKTMTYLQRGTLLLQCSASARVNACGVNMSACQRPVFYATGY